MRLLNLAVLSVFIAVTANLLIAEALRPPPGSAEIVRPRAAPAQRALEPSRLASLFGTPLRPTPPAVPAAPLALKLLGTLEGRDPTHSAAALCDALSGRCRTLREGDGWNGVEVVAIGRGEVQVRRGDGVEVLRVHGGTAMATALQPQVRLHPGGALLSMPRSEIQRQLPDLIGGALKGGRLIPAFIDGRPAGFKVFSIVPGSIYDVLGLRNGDVIEAVNGTRLASPEAVLTLGPGLINEPRITMAVNRGGAALTWELQIL